MNLSKISHKSFHNNENNSDSENDNFRFSNRSEKFINSVAESSKKENFMFKTARSLNSYHQDTNNNSFSKTLPSIISEYEDALKKSNANVLGLKQNIFILLENEKRLKERVCELEEENSQNKIRSSIKIDKEHISKNYKLKYEECLEELQQLRMRNEDMEKEKSYFEKEIEEKESLLEEKNEIINSMKKAFNSSLNLISNNEQFNKDSNILKIEFQNEQTINKELKMEIEKLKNTINKYKSEREKIHEKIKKLKEELKQELNEKIELLKELEKLRDIHMMSLEKQGTLREKFQYDSVESEKINMKNKLIEKEKEIVDKEFQDLKVDYDFLKSEYDKLCISMDTLTKERKTYLEEEQLNQYSKLDETNFILNCELNLWKAAFIEISKYKLVKYDYKMFGDLIKIDMEYLKDAPNILKDKIDYTIIHFKKIFDEQESKSKDLKNLKQDLLAEHEKIIEIYNDYKQELRLRRKIHNRYMMLRGNMRIMARVRPFIEGDNTPQNKKFFKESFKVFNDSITIIDNNKTRKYDLDYIFNQKNNQHEVYDEVSMLVQNMKTEVNICVIAYGQTCTGKTYTIDGPNKSNPGITLRTAKELFEMSEENKQNNFKISLSIIEIYNENIYNLLTDGTPELSLYENSHGNLCIPELNPISISSYDEAVKLCSLAKKLRYTNQNLYNDRSSRSHCIYTFFLKFKEGDKVKKSRMHIVDLAGSERLSRNNIYDENFRKESISINLSLNSLSNVLNAISLKQSHIPYRDSKLTHFLKESLNEDFNIFLMLHLSPKLSDVHETISTLEFGTRLGKFCKYKTGKEKTHNRTHSHAPPKQNKI